MFFLYLLSVSSINSAPTSWFKFDFSSAQSQRSSSPWTQPACITLSYFPVSLLVTIIKSSLLLTFPWVVFNLMHPKWQTIWVQFEVSEWTHYLFSYSLKITDFPRLTTEKAWWHSEFSSSSEHHKCLNFGPENHPPIKGTKSSWWNGCFQVWYRKWIRWTWNIQNNKEDNWSYIKGLRANLKKASTGQNGHLNINNKTGK